MPANDPRHLISGYITGSLTKTEKDQLAREALNDDKLMEELFDAEPMRDALEDPAFRAELKATLRRAKEAERPSLWDRIGAFFAKRWVIPVAIAVASLTVAIVTRYPFSTGGEELHISLSMQGLETKALGLFEISGPEIERWRRSQEAPPRTKAKASLGLDRAGTLPSYVVGDKQRIGFRVDEDARVVVLEERPDGTILRLFPNALQTDSLVRAGTQVLVPLEGQGNMIVDGPPGKRTIRILLFPRDVDPLAADQSWDELQRNASAAERQFEVRP